MIGKNIRSERHPLPVQAISYRNQLKSHDLASAVESERDIHVDILDNSARKNDVDMQITTVNL